MFQDYIKILDRAWSKVGPNAIDALAKALADILSIPKKLQHLHRWWCDFMLPDGDSDGMVRLCATKNNPDEDSPPIALNIACGAFKFHDQVYESPSDLVADLDPEELAELIEAALGTLPNYDPDRPQIPISINGQLQWVNVNASACGGGEGLPGGGGGFLVNGGNGDQAVMPPPAPAPAGGAIQGGDAPHLN